MDTCGRGDVPASLRRLNASAWLADFGRDFMGGLTLSLPVAAFPVGSAVRVTLGEELVGDPRTSTTILYPMRTGNHYRNQFVKASDPYGHRQWLFSPYPLL